MKLKQEIEKELKRLDSITEVFCEPYDWFTIEGAKSSLKWVLKPRRRKS